MPQKWCKPPCQIYLFLNWRIVDTKIHLTQKFHETVSLLCEIQSDIFCYYIKCWLYSHIASQPSNEWENTAWGQLTLNVFSLRPVPSWISFLSLPQWHHTDFFPLPLWPPLPCRLLDSLSSTVYLITAIWAPLSFPLYTGDPIPALPAMTGPDFQLLWGIWMWLPCFHTNLNKPQMTFA